MKKNKKEKIGVQSAKNKNRSVVFLLDETGSMYSCMTDTIGGFNSFIDKQLAENSDMSFSLTLFNSEKIEKRYVNVPIKDVEKLSNENYNPNHSTPLWDAIGKTILELKKNNEVLFIILTDGYENSSKEFSSSEIKSLIVEKEKEGWQFLFLGASLENFNDAHLLGIKNMSAYSKENTAKSFNAIGDTVTSYYRSGKLSYVKNIDGDKK